MRAITSHNDQEINKIQPSINEKINQELSNEQSNIVDQKAIENLKKDQRSVD